MPADADIAPATDGIARRLDGDDEARYVVNVAAPPADAPDRETVARLLDEMMAEDDDAAPVPDPEAGSVPGTAAD